MKAIQLEQPKQFRRIEIADVTQPGLGGVQLRVHRIGICGTDISGYLGKMPFFSYPRIPGHELGVEVLPDNILRESSVGPVNVIAYAGTWTFDKRSRAWTEGLTATSNVPGSTATFTFTGTSVSWIGCEKGSAGGTADVYIDGVFREQVKLHQNYPIEGYQMTVFRADGLAPGQHALKIEVINTNGSYVVVDAFDVR